MKIVFDLDYTLMDTVKFKEALVEAVTSCGPTPAQYDAAYAEIVAKKGMFDPDDLFDALQLSFPDDVSGRAARLKFDNVLTTSDKYLYPGAIELLKVLQTHHATIDLMTFGNAKWQREKVVHSGLVELFDEVITTEKEKKEIVREAGKGEDKVIFVNDNGQEIKEMREAVPEYTYILKKGPKPIPSDLQLPTATDMGELTILLENETGWELRREMREAREGKGELYERDVRESGEYKTRKPDGSSEQEPPAERGQSLRQ